MKHSGLRKRCSAELSVGPLRREGPGQTQQDTRRTGEHSSRSTEPSSSGAWLSRRAPQENYLSLLDKRVKAVVAPWNIAISAMSAKIQASSYWLPVSSRNCGRQPAALNSGNLGLE